MNKLSYDGRMQLIYLSEGMIVLIILAVITLAHN